MFWRSTSTFGQPSAVDLVLDRSDASLELLLDEDDLQQVLHAWDAPWLCPAAVLCARTRGTAAPRCAERKALSRLSHTGEANRALAFPCIPKMLQDRLLCAS